MSPTRSHGRGTFLIDRRFRGLRRIRRASGTTDAKVFRQLYGMLDTLYQAGRLDVLEELRDGRVTALQVWKHYRLGHWSRIPTSDHARPLRESLDAYRKTVRGEHYRRDLASYFKALLAHARSGASVADLPTALERYSAACERQGTATMFNRTRSAAQAFARKMLRQGRKHPLWLEIAALEPLGVTPKRTKNPQTPDSARTIAEVLGGEAGRIWWVLCCSGMGPDEYFSEKWAVEDGRLHVKGTKRAARDRLLPIIAAPFEPTLSRWGFTSALRRAGLGVTPYDARRTFANWCERAGLIQTDIDLLLGHGPRTMTQLYTWHRIEGFLNDCEAKLRAFLGEEPSRTSPPTAPVGNDVSVSGPTRNRTENLLIKSQLLCQLSYRP